MSCPPSWSAAIEQRSPGADRAAARAAARWNASASSRTCPGVRTLAWPEQRHPRRRRDGQPALDAVRERLALERQHHPTQDREPGPRLTP